MIEIIKSGFHEELAFESAKRLLEQVKIPYHAFYCDLGSRQDFVKWLAVPQQYQHQLVIIFLKDIPDCSLPYGYWDDRKPYPGSVLLDQHMQQHPDNYFLIASTTDNHRDEIFSKNCSVMTWACDAMMQLDRFKTVSPLLEKNLDKEWHFISLNRATRLHRITALSYLYGLGLDQFGHITCMDKGTRADQQHPMLSAVDEFRPDLKEIFSAGIEKFYSTEFPDHFLNFTHRDDHKNFIEKLVPLYDHSVVEIVNGTSHSTPAFSINEKHMYPWYACNFPIFNDSAGVVQHLRHIGFDMFDDIVDHGYDSEPKGFVRIIDAVDRNRRLLSDRDWAVDLWRKNRHRFQHNVDLAKKIDSWYWNRAQKEFDSIIAGLV